MQVCVVLGQDTQPHAHLHPKSNFVSTKHLTIIHLEEAEPSLSLLRQPSSSSSKIAKDPKQTLKGVVSSFPENVPEKDQILQAKSSKATTTDINEMPQSQSNVPPTTWPIFFELDLQIVSPQNMNSIKIDNGATHTEILIRTPSNVELMGKLKDSKDEKIFGGDRVFFDRHRTLWRCLFAPNQNGTFKAMILAKRKSDPGSYTGACSYTLEARQIPSTPFSYPKTWQLFHDLDLKIETSYDRATIVWPENASYVEIRMRAPNDVYLSCNIKYNDITVDNGTLTQFDSDKHNWQLLFAPQRTGLHMLWVYAKRENDAGSTSSSVAQFHLNVTQLKQSIKFPLTYTKFQTNKCRILEPIHGTLKKGSVVLIHCIVPGATDVSVTIDSDWNESGGYQDPIFKTKVTVGSKDVTVYAKYAQKGSYDGLFEYTVQ
jgi:hypothetical protein